MSLLVDVQTTTTREDIHMGIGELALIAMATASLDIGERRRDAGDQKSGRHGHRRGYFVHLPTSVTARATFHVPSLRTSVTVIPLDLPLLSSRSSPVAAS